MTERTSTFRVFRIVETVPHLNLFDTEADRLYTVFESGYRDRQPAVDDLRTGDLIEATVTGDPDASDDPWRLDAFTRVGRVEMDFAVDVDPPAAAEDRWEDGRERPAGTTLEADPGGEPVAEMYVQPREPLPSKMFVPNVLTGLVPMEPWLRELPTVGAPATHAMFIDPDPPDAQRFSRPYGVVVLFGPDAGTTLAEFRRRYDLPAGADTRPDFDPYAIE